MFKDAEILIADDNSLYSLHLKTQLEKKGYSKIEITNEAKGVLFCLDNKKYHLVICPHNLTEMTAEELILRVRFGMSKEQPCFLVLSDEWNSEPTLFNHVSSYSISPIELESLDKTIRNLLLEKFSGVGVF